MRYDSRRQLPMGTAVPLTLTVLFFASASCWLLGISSGASSSGPCSTSRPLGLNAACRGGRAGLRVLPGRPYPYAAAASGSDTPYRREPSCARSVPGVRGALWVKP